MSTTVKIEQIDYPVFHDIDPEKLNEFKESIKQLGLLHPITVRATDDNRYKFITGKYRLTALLELKQFDIPVEVITGEIDDLEYHLQENLKRQNLQWYEQVEIEKELHDLRMKQHGKRRTGAWASREKGWSQQDTAKELGISIGSMSQDLQLANALKRNPHLRNVNDKQTAMRLVREAAKRDLQESETLIEDPGFTSDQVFCGNSLDILKELPANLFHACITDPPWTEYKDEHLTRDDSTVSVFGQIYRVLKNDSFLYAIVSTGDFFLYKTELPKFGFRVQEYPILWHKTGTISHGRRIWEYARDYEPILVAVKGNPSLTTGTQLSSLLQFAAVHSSKLIHPNEKPVDLLKRIIGQCTYDGARILDPFAGSGATLLAAKESGRGFIGIERDYKFYQNIRKRLGI